MEFSVADNFILSQWLNHLTLTTVQPVASTNVLVEVSNGAATEPFSLWMKVDGVPMAVSVVPRSDGRRRSSLAVVISAAECEDV